MQQEEKVIDAGFPPAPAEPIQDYSPVVKVVFYWTKILNARLIALLALIGALGVFSFAMYDPTVLRLWLVSLYSVGVLWPSIALYLKRGTT